MKFKDITESSQKCPHCGGPLVEYSGLMEKKEACYYKVKASAKVWPSAYASGRLVQCRKKGAANYGNKSEGVAEGQDNPYGYRKGQTVKLDNGTQGRVIDIFDDSIEVLLVGGRTVTVDFRDAQVISEQQSQKVFKK